MTAANPKPIPHDPSRRAALLRWLLATALATLYLVAAEPLTHALGRVLEPSLAVDLALLAGPLALALAGLASLLWLGRRRPGGDSAAHAGATPLAAWVAFEAFLVTLAVGLLALVRAGHALGWVYGLWFALLAAATIIMGHRVKALAAAVTPPDPGPPLHPDLQALAARAQFPPQRLRVAALPPGLAGQLRLVRGRPWIEISPMVRDEMPLSLQRAVLAHELGHYACRHGRWEAWQGLAWVASAWGAAFLFAWLASVRLSGPLDAPRIAGLFVIAWAPACLAASFLTCWLARRNELQANAWAMRATGDPASLVAVFEWLDARQGTSSKPGRLAWLLHTRPSTDRIKAQAAAFTGDQAPLRPAPPDHVHGSNRD